MTVTEPVQSSLPVPERPTVSILIAARNEEHTILNCLQSIDRLNLSQSVIEILIGNDQSTDRTEAVVSEFVADKPAFRLVTISEAYAGLAGKANVLAQLVRQARGQLLLFTDADTQVPPDWVSGMSYPFTRKVGIVTGVTLPDGHTLFHKLQTIDWLYNLTLTHLLSSLGVAVTAMGNNMAVSREAYQAVGGYEALPFSVVEDYTLFQAVTRKDFDYRNLLDERVLASTQPVDTVRQFLNQRKRWMRGAVALPVWMVLLLFAQYLTAPILALVMLFSPMLAITLYLSKLLVQTTVLSFGLSRLHRTSLWPYALLFEIYQLLIGPIAVIYYVLPTGIEWKGRKYK